MNIEGMLSPPEGYVALRCVVGFGCLPENVDKLLKQVGIDATEKFGAPPEMVLSVIYINEVLNRPLHLIADLRWDAEPDGTIGITVDQQTCRSHCVEVPPEFIPMIREAQARPF